MTWPLASNLGPLVAIYRWWLPLLMVTPTHGSGCHWSLPTVASTYSDPMKKNKIPNPPPNLQPAPSPSPRHPHLFSTPARFLSPDEDSGPPPMTQKEKNAFGSILNFSYESETRVVLANAGGIQIFGNLLKAFRKKVIDCAKKKTF